MPVELARTNFVTKPKTVTKRAMASKYFLDMNDEDYELLMKHSRVTSPRTSCKDIKTM